MIRPVDLSNENFTATTEPDRESTGDILDNKGFALCLILAFVLAAGLTGGILANVGGVL